MFNFIKRLSIKLIEFVRWHAEKYHELDDKEYLDYLDRINALSIDQDRKKDWD